MSEALVKKIHSLKAPTEPGVHHRLMFMTGRMKGLSVYISGDRLVLGRGEQVDVQVPDPKSSREHAELKFINGEYVLTDLGSQNGIMVNDLRVSQHKLEDNDKIIIGATVLKYNYFDIEVSQRLQLVDIEAEEEDEEEEEVIEELPKSAKEKKKSSKRIYIYIAILGALFFLLPDEEPRKAPSKVASKKSQKEVSIPSRDFSEDLDPESREKVMANLHRGLRELREKNFFRAIDEFKTALILDPGNGRASFYLQKAQQNLDEHIESMFDKAQNDVDSLKYESAALQYCSIKTYLKNYPEDERFLAAKKNLDFLIETNKIGKDDYSCQ